MPVLPLTSILLFHPRYNYISNITYKMSCQLNFLHSDRLIISFEKSVFSSESPVTRKCQRTVKKIVRMIPVTFCVYFRTRNVKLYIISHFLNEISAMRILHHGFT